MRGRLLVLLGLALTMGAPTASAVDAWVYWYDDAGNCVIGVGLQSGPCAPVPGQSGGSEGFGPDAGVEAGGVSVCVKGGVPKVGCGHSDLPIDHLMFAASTTD